MTRPLLLARLLAVGVAALATTGCGSSAGWQPAAPATAAPLGQLTGPVAAVLAPAGTVFGPGSVWRLDVSRAPLAADSAMAAASVAANVARRYGGVAAFNVHSYDVSYVVAAPDTPTYDVAFDDCQDKGYVPEGLPAQFAGVPVPADATPSSGSDATLSIYQPLTDRLWELWRARRTATGWQACFGGRLDHASTSLGFFSDGFGASATGLAYVGGMVGIQEALAGHIDHALALTLVDPAVAVSYPAQRSDGSSTAPDAVEEGQRLRLDPTLDVDALGLTSLATMIAKAAQKYGFIVTDRSGAVALGGEGGASAQRITGRDPWQAIERGVPDYLVLKGFPWDRLQVLPPDYGRPN